MSIPLHKREAHHWKTSGDGSAQARRHVGNSGASLSKSFCTAPKFVVLRKICFKRMIKKYFPPKNVFCLQTLKPGYGPGL